MNNMMPQQEPSATPPKAAVDEVNRLWQHGLHEERLFHDRLNSFSALEMGLLTVCGIMYNKEPALGFFLLLTVLALLFTFLWLTIQLRHWAYCEHINRRMQRLAPEFKITIDEFFAQNRSGGLSISKPLALAVPPLFACMWMVFLIWLIFQPTAITVPDQFLSMDRLLMLIFGGMLGWVVIKLIRLEAKVSKR